MIGAIAGDVIGSVYEHHPADGPDFRPLVAERACFTDDTVLTVATADAILHGGDYAAAYRAWGTRYPRAGYGGSFRQWLATPGAGPYNSWGNGSAMRVSPVGWAFGSETDVLREAARSAAVTHDHAEGIKGARAVALAVFMARGGAEKDEIRREISDRFGYDLARTVDEIRPDYGFHVSCMKSVPEALVVFLDSVDPEHAIRLAVSLGGDADTQAAIAGSVAEAFYRGGIPEPVRAPVLERLTPDLRAIVDAFETRFVRPAQNVSD
ncbi:ADP-ribosylglycohydrolase family protein [Longimicrobium sp.]|uniref:ADP-ribosylglycohydrolase family protein n=1 Tax=Longimicrobium sp. TaxID=2029185 RepID=UPI002C591B0F|nr:ADP-ribosylglycohydrolase family protein [Longimicrobium sp.]HSU14422.1 ADP-ribosylglycohydrolase family protein [Longimicrobium sp.]